MLTTGSSALAWFATVAFFLPYFSIFAFRLPTNTQRFVAFLPPLAVTLGEFYFHLLFNDTQYGRPIRFLLAGVNLGACARLYIYLCLQSDYERSQLLKLSPMTIVWQHLLRVRKEWQPKPAGEQQVYETYSGRIVQFLVMLVIWTFVNSELHTFDIITVVPLWRIQTVSQFRLLLRYSVTFVVWLYLWIHAMSELVILILPLLTLGSFPLCKGIFDYMFQPLVESTSLTTFWTSSWQQSLKQTFQLLAFNPVKRWTATKSNPRGNVPLAVLLVFVSSGLLHEWALQCSFSTHDTKRPTFPLTQLLFFTGHGVTCLAERALVKQFRQYITIPTAISRLLTLSVLFLSSTWVFSSFAESNWQHDLPVTIVDLFYNILVRPWVQSF